MAKKRKEKEEEQELDFKKPKFDKEKFIKTEKQHLYLVLQSLSFLLVFGYY